jgi:hypothetical protein
VLKELLLMIASLFYDVGPCNLVEIYRRSVVLGACNIRAMMGAAVTSEMWVTICQISRRDISEESNIYSHRVRA